MKPHNLDNHNVCTVCGLEVFSNNKGAFLNSDSMQTLVATRRLSVYMYLSEENDFSADCDEAQEQVKVFKATYMIFG